MFLSSSWEAGASVHPRPVPGHLVHTAGGVPGHGLRSAHPGSGHPSAPAPPPTPCHPTHWSCSYVRLDVGAVAILILALNLGTEIYHCSTILILYFIIKTLKASASAIAGVSHVHHCLQDCKHENIVCRWLSTQFLSFNGSIALLINILQQHHTTQVLLLSTILFCSRLFTLKNKIILQIGDKWSTWHSTKFFFCF